MEGSRNVRTFSLRLIKFYWYLVYDFEVLGRLLVMRNINILALAYYIIIHVELYDFDNLLSDFNQINNLMYYYYIQYCIVYILYE